MPSSRSSTFTVRNGSHRDVQIVDVFKRCFSALTTQLVEAMASLLAHKVQLQNAKMEFQRTEGIIADVDRPTGSGSPSSKG